MSRELYNIEYYSTLEKVTASLLRKGVERPSKNQALNGLKAFQNPKQFPFKTEIIITDS
jgi:hypothetical protein